VLHCVATVQQTAGFVTHSYVCHDSLACVTRLIQTQFNRLRDSYEMALGQEVIRGSRYTFVVAACYVLQCVAVCCSVLQCVAARNGSGTGSHSGFSVKVCCCSVLCVAVCCSVLQYVAVCCSVL